ncbi:MAG: hypothetical protein ABIQ15_02360 [Nocardioides sp.]
MRRTILTVLAVLVALVGLGAAAVAVGGGSSTVTRPRLERALPATFAHLYADQAVLLGRDGITSASLHPKAACDKHGPDVADVGPGGDWICLMSWQDPNVPMPSEGYGKFELNVHSNDCFTAIGQTKLTGFLTLTDTRGREVPNPVFEFDGCFDPQGDNSATGTSFPSLLAVTSTALTPEADGRVGVQLSCGTGSEGCRGSIVVTAGDAALGRVPFDLKEESTVKVAVPTALPPGAEEVSFEVHTETGFGPSSAVTLSVQGS